MKILIVNRLMGILWGGGETFDYNLARTLKNEGHYVSILTGKPLLSNSINKIDLNVTYISSPYLRKFCYYLTGKLPKLPIGLLQLDLYLFEIKAFNYIKHHLTDFDVIQILSMPRLAQKILNKLNKPVVLWFPGPPSETWDIPIIKSLLTNPLIKFFAAGDTISFLNKRNIFIENIPNGVDILNFCKNDNKKSIRKKYSIKKNEILLFSAGRLIPGKGFEFLIKGFKKALEAYKPLKLMIAGEGILFKELQRLSEQYKIKNKVIFTGKIPHQQLPIYYSSSNIFLLLSSYENYSNAILEAMACELPVIATNVGGFPMQINQNENGFLVTYNNVDELASKILTLAKDKKLREKIGKINREKVVQMNSWEKTTQKVLELYKNVTKIPKKVLFVIPNLSGGGAERVLHTLLKNMNKKSFDISCMFYDSDHAFTLPEDVKYYTLNEPGTDNFFVKLIKIIKRITKLTHFILKNEPDVIVSFMNTVNFVCIISNFIANILSQKKSSLIVTEHNTLSIRLKKKKSKVYKFIIKILVNFLYKFSDKIVAVSRGVKQDLAVNFGVNRKKITVINNPVDLEQIKIASQKKNELSKKLNYIINIGALTEQKNQFTLLKAFSIILQKLNSTKIRLLILGKGPLEHELKETAKKLKIESYVEFKGFVQNPYAYLKDSKVFILSSKFEGFPVVLLEALACQVPIVSTNCKSGPSEIIRHGFNGFLVPVGDEHAIAHFTIQLLKDNALYERIKENVRQTVANYRVDKIIKTYEELLKNV